MPTRHRLEVSGIRVDVIRKDIKNLHVAVYPPHGRVRVAAPLRLDDEAVRLAIVSRLHWIRRQRKQFAEQIRQSEREMVTGESHYFQGRRYLLDIVERSGAAGVRIVNNRTLRLAVPHGTDRSKRHQVLNQWYRRQLRKRIPDLIRHWEAAIGVKVSEWGIRRMKTRWGSCNPDARRIWVNLELAKKPPQCLDYIVVHEMVHFLERHHNERFRQLMTKFMPNWSLHRDTLNQAPLSHEDWDY